MPNDNLQQITDLLNNHPDYWARLIETRHDPIQPCDYLILFARRHTEKIPTLALMGDHGITWRPFKPKDTPCYAHITIDNPHTAAQHLMKLADAFDNDQLPLDAEEGEGTGQYLIQQ